jgi:hypothetical protein
MATLLRRQVFWNLRLALGSGMIARLGESRTAANVALSARASSPGKDVPDTGVLGYTVL